MLRLGLLLAAATAVAAATVRRIRTGRSNLRLCAASDAAAEPPLPSGALDAAVDRSGTHSRKMQGRAGEFLGRSPAVVPLWVADMDFRSPQPVVDALVARAANGVYGYTDCPPQLSEALCERLRTVYGCALAPSASWFRWLPGLLPGLNHAVRVACAPDGSEAVAVPTPVYAPFLASPPNNNAELLKVPLELRVENGEMRFGVDWAALESALAQPACKLLHWCNPHNPTGRCWTRSELARVARLCVAHEVLLCSDEVWGELPLDSSSAPFISMLALLAPPADTSGADTRAAEVAAATETLRTGADADAAGGVAGLHRRLIVLTSPSKCFNVAPLDIATAIIPDDSLRRRFRRAGADAAEVSCFGYVAGTVAYTDSECELWRQRLVAYVRSNRDYAAGRLREMGIDTVVPEASYLMWMDASNALPPGTNAHSFFLDQASVGLTGGVDFGGGLGTVRLNLGCTRATLTKGLDRMAAAIAAARVDPS